MEKTPAVLLTDTVFFNFINILLSIGKNLIVRCLKIKISGSARRVIPFASYPVISDPRFQFADQMVDVIRQHTAFDDDFFLFVRRWIDDRYLHIGPLFSLSSFISDFLRDVYPLYGMLYKNFRISFNFLLYTADSGSENPSISFYPRCCAYV